MIVNDERRTAGLGVSLRCAPGRAARAVGQQTTLPNCAEPPSRQALSTTRDSGAGAPGSRPCGRASLTRSWRLDGLFGALPTAWLDTQSGARLTRSRRLRGLAGALLLASAAACATDGGGDPHGSPIRVTVPAGSSLSAASDSLAARGIVASSTKFRRYASSKDAAARLKPGIYEFRAGESWRVIVDKLVSGDVVKARIVVPEGWTARQIAARIAAALGGNADSVYAGMIDTVVARRYGVPGPTLEGYLYPATYVFPLGTSREKAIQEMVRRYQSAWTPAMRAQLPATKMTERQVVTLASIVEREAKDWRERPTIAAVYHNRLRIGMRLQADPTVQYALGQQRARLLYRDIASVAGDPYNTYTHAGLPPGPIASPSQGAIQATLQPGASDALYFVARPNGTHVFTRTLAEHNAAKRASRAEARAANPRPPARR